ncbi:MAG: hypothetical protein ACNYPG_01020 [Candidatus Porifericomitaceae bacterium WSBS_2022_MAG_OTU9]
MNWFWNFRSESCGVLLATAAQAVLFRRSKLRWQHALRFFANDNSAEFADLLKSWRPNVPLYLIADENSENFHCERLARTGRRDRIQLLQRLQQKLFPDSAMVRSQVQGDRVCMSTLAMENKTWLQLLESNAVPIAGIYTPAILLQQLAKHKAWLKCWPHVLLLSLHALSGLRQTAFCDGTIVFSRCMALAAENWPEPEAMREELVRVINYWSGASADGRKRMLVVYAPEHETHAIKEILSGLLAAGEITLCSYRVGKYDLHPACDMVLAQRLAAGVASVPGYPLPGQLGKQWRNLKIARNLVRIAAAVSIVAMLLLVFVAPRANMLRHGAVELELLARRDNALMEQLPEPEMELAKLERQVLAAATLDPRIASPAPIFNWLGRAGIIGGQGVPGLNWQHLDWSFSGHKGHARLVMRIPEGTAMASALRKLETVLAMLDSSSPIGFIAGVEHEPISLQDSGTAGGNLVLKLSLEHEGHN